MKAPLLALLIMSLAPLASSQESVAAPTVPADKAVALVSAMQVDQFLLYGIQVALQRGVAEGKATQAQIDCLKGLDYGFVRQGYADLVARKLTPAEVDEALAFFESRGGQLSVEAGWQLARKMYPNPERTSDEKPFPDPTPEEQRQVLNYMNSPLARKINELNDRANLAEIEAGIKQVVMPCLKQP